MCGSGTKHGPARTFHCPSRRSFSSENHGPRIAAEIYAEIVVADPGTGRAPSDGVPRRARGGRWCRGRQARGVQSSTSRMRLAAATDTTMSPGRRPAKRTGKSWPMACADRVQHFADRIAAAVAAVQRRAGAARAQIIQRRKMRAREIADMDEVADAGAVRASDSRCRRRRSARGGRARLRPRP